MLLVTKKCFLFVKLEDSLDLEFYLHKRNYHSPNMIKSSLCGAHLGEGYKKGEIKTSGYDICTCVEFIAFYTTAYFHGSLNGVHSFTCITSYFYS